MNAEQFIANEARKQKQNDFTLTAGEIHSKPLTFKQLSERLKHIAGLCWGLSIDLQNEIKYRHALEAERERLEDENKALRAELRELSQKAHSNEQYKKRVLADRERLKVEMETAQAAELSPEMRKEAQKKYKREYMRKRRGGSSREEKLNEKLAAMTPEEREKYLKQLEAKRKYTARYLAKKRAAQGGNNV